MRSVSILLKRATRWLHMKYMPPLNPSLRKIIKQ